MARLTPQPVGDSRDAPVDVDGHDGSGLGDSGGGFHMVIDMGALLEIFAPPDEPNPFEGGIAYDMYAFVQGDHVLMVMVMRPADQSSGVDGRDLAGLMDGRSEF